VPGVPGARALVLDANILVRAVLGRRVLSLVETYAGRVSFFTAEVAYDDARRHLPQILVRRGLPAEDAERLIEEVLNRLSALVVPVPQAVYAKLESEARRRLLGRDEADWPFVALALRFACPIWTEDQDFFGTGVATWTTDRVELYLAAEE
jgi:predicted nucleic acid-binding protein